jgi:uncharacterized membrane protein YebE (DUF533 family)
MEIERPNAQQQPTPEELKDLEQLRAVLERAIADGVISSSEIEAYKMQAWADGKITPQELALYQELVLSKITAGELSWDLT